ncbi:MAG: ABC transporter permease [Caldilineaceae bacterium]
MTVSAQTSFGFSRGGLQTSSTPLTNEEVDAITALATAVRYVAPQYNSNGTVVYSGKLHLRRSTAQVYGDVRNWEIERGRFVSAEDNANLATVVVLGQTVVEDLFGTTLNPIGQIVRINRQNYEVVGVLKSKGQTGFKIGTEIIFMPIRTAQLKLGGAGNQDVSQISTYK